MGARGNDAGAWFWWGRAGQHVCWQIYGMMRNVFLNEHKLDNLIWVWSEPNSDWYPGNDIVDILGIDSYPAAFDYSCNEAMWNHYLNMTDCKKMLTLAEVGTIPAIDKCYSQGIRWLYFLAWGTLVTTDNSNEHLHEVYNSSHVKSVEDLLLDTQVL